MKFIRIIVLLTVVAGLSLIVGWRAQAPAAVSWVNTLASWLPSANLPIQEPSEPMSPSVDLKADSSLVDTVAQLLSFEQPYLTQNACLRSIIKPAIETPPAAASVFKWKDEDGRVHYSDRKPKSTLSADIGSTLEQKKSRFSMQYETVGTGAPVGLRDRLRYSTDKIFELLSEGLSIENTRTIDLNIRIYERENEYRALWKHLYPNSSSNAPGFYSLSENLAVVLKRQNPEDTTRTAIHEAAHVVIAGLYGGTPRWFTEGFAEYVEPIDVRGQLASVKSKDYWFRVLRSLAQEEGLPSLADYWAIPRGQWEGELKNRYYAIAWSVIAFMMDDPERRKNLSAFMGDMESNFCNPLGSSRLDVFYAGGFDSLQRDWEQWVIQSKGFTHRF